MNGPAGKRCSVAFRGNAFALVSLNETAGTTCELELERSDAYLPDPTINQFKNAEAALVQKDVHQ